MASENPAGAPAAKKVAVFDLDGTLLDTTRDLALAVNHTLAAFGKRYYGVHALDHTLPYAGVPECVAALRAAGVAVAVVSNKADFAVQEIIDARMPGCFDAVLGECEARGIRRKPAPDMVLAVLEQLGADRDGLIYIGDSEVDVACARACGCPCVSVSWGFRSREQLVAAGATRIVDTPDELQRVLLSM